MAFITPSPLPAHRKPTSTTTSIRPTTITIHPLRKASLPSMVLDIPPKKPDSIVCIPQHTPDLRKTALDAQRKHYVWNADNPLPVKTLPASELPSVEWIGKAIASLAKANANFNAAAELKQLTSTLQLMFERLNSGGIAEENAEHVVEGLAAALYQNVAPEDLRDVHYGNDDGFAAYKALFRTIRLDDVAKFNQFLRDDVFGWYRIAGPNPMRLAKLDKSVDELFPSWDLNTAQEIFRGIDGFEHDSIRIAADEGRLYVVDYPDLKDIQTGTINGEKKSSFVYAPRALFAVPRHRTGRNFLMPIAIQCGQDDSYPVYSANKQHTHPTTWLAAKITVQVADAYVHETIHHLARTHLLVLPIIGACKRTLPPMHPLMTLLDSHFEGTVFIGWTAPLGLFNKGGLVDQATAPPIEFTAAIADGAVHGPSFSFNDAMLHRDFERRGVLDESLHYPYRDDALRIWDAIQEWVDVYLRQFYANDNDLQNDHELRDWCREVSSSDRGNIQGFGQNPDGTIQTIEYLVQAVTMIIFTASAQHAALHFPHQSMMKFAPAMPLAGYAPSPKGAKPFADEADLIAQMYPPLDKAALQLKIASIIGEIHHTTLGEYGSTLQGMPGGVAIALERFQNRLREIEASIMNRNAQEMNVGLPAYSYLLPSNIPQSINI